MTGDEPLDELVARLRAAGCVLAEEEARLLVETATSDRRHLREMVEQRIAGQPLEHILGWARFGRHRVAIEPGVFVPRHRSEALVGAAVSILRPLVRGSAGRERRPVLVDLCCGTGALALATVSAAIDGTPDHFIPTREFLVEVHAADIDPVAVGCATANLEPIGARVHAGDLFDALPEHLAGRVDVVVANVPYVPTAGIRLLPPEARDHEASLALDGGGDGLDVLRRVAGGAGRWLRLGGRVLFEVAEDQAPAASAAVVTAGLQVELIEDDEDARVLIGRYLASDQARKQT